MCYFFFLSTLYLLFLWIYIFFYSLFYQFFILKKKQQQTDFLKDPSTLSGLYEQTPRARLQAD